jgi:xanthine dehydrogenase YagS FAD-binding subunit
LLSNCCVVRFGRALRRLVLNGVAPIPWRVRQAEVELEGHEPSAERIARAAEVAVAEATPLAKNGYKVPLAQGLIRQALTRLAG